MKVLQAYNPFAGHSKAKKILPEVECLHQAIEVFWK
jgi:diacylglycerol kinase family enzyme